MPRILGGYTELGRQINKQSTSGVRGNIDKINYKKAIIYKTFQNTYIFQMRLEDGSITAPIPVVGAAGDLAMRYGSPVEMEGVWEVIIQYKGTSVNRGIAQIVRKINNTIDAEAVETEASNQLAVRGTAFAPPGAGC